MRLQPHYRQFLIQSLFLQIYLKGSIFLVSLDFSLKIKLLEMGELLHVVSLYILQFLADTFFPLFFRFRTSTTATVSGNCWRIWSNSLVFIVDGKQLGGIILHHLFVIPNVIVKTFFLGSPYAVCSG